MRLADGQERQQLRAVLASGSWWVQEEEVVLLAAVAAERMRVGGRVARQEAVAELLAVAASVSRNKYVRTTD